MHKIIHDIFLAFRIFSTKFIKVLQKNELNFYLLTQQFILNLYLY